MYVLEGVPNFSCLVPRGPWPASNCQRAGVCSGGRNYPAGRSRRQFLSFPRQRRGLAATGAKSRMVVAGLEREGVCGRNGSLKNAPPPRPSPPRLRGRSRGHPCRRLAQVLRVFPAIQRDFAGPWRCSLPEDSRGRRSNWHRRESPKKHTHARFTRSDLPSSETLVIHFPGHGTLVTLRG